MREHDLHCARCDGELRHDGPELVCTVCGLAEATVPVTMRVWLRAGAARIAPHQRRAA